MDDRQATLARDLDEAAGMRFGEISSDAQPLVNFRSLSCLMSMLVREGRANAADIAAHARLMRAELRNRSTV